MIMKITDTLVRRPCTRSSILLLNDALGIYEYIQVRPTTQIESVPRMTVLPDIE